MIKKYLVTAEDFDGTKFATKYTLDPHKDFYAGYENGNMFIVLREGLTLPDDPPIFESSDTINQDRLAVLTAKLETQGLTTFLEVSEYLKLKIG